MEYIHGLCNDYITGKSDFTAEELMNLADIMYKAQTQMNELLSLSTEQEEIVALNPKIAHLNKQLKQEKNPRPSPRKRIRIRRKVMTKTENG